MMQIANDQKEEYLRQMELYKQKKGEVVQVIYLKAKLLFSHE